MSSFAQPREKRVSEQSPKLSRLIAKQPILTGAETIIGYELLFRDGFENHCTALDLNRASHSVIDTASLLGIDLLCDTGIAFINCTRNVLLDGSCLLLPPERTVIEILETIPPDEEVLEACRTLKKAGYRIALDDFVFNDPRESLVHLADFVKVDLRLTSAAEASEIVARHRNSGCQLVAEKVETEEEFQQAKKAGFHLFQGYFFRRPQIVRTRRAVSNKTICLRLLQASSSPELSWRDVENLLKSDPVLCFRLLRHLNSAAFGLENPVTSIAHALLILGEEDFRRWCRLVALLEIARHKPMEIALSALTRARFSELLGHRLGFGTANLFLMGLLSLIDSILDRPLSLVLDSLPVHEEVRAALLKREGPLAQILSLVLATEGGEWRDVGNLSQGLNFAEEILALVYWEAVSWARGCCNHAKAIA